MDETQEKKREIRNQITKLLASLSEQELAEKTKRIHERLFDFANFLEARIPLLYISSGYEISTKEIIKHALKYHKVVVLPVYEKDKYKIRLMKIDHPEKDLRIGPKGILEPDPAKCKPVPLDYIEIALIPGIAFDEKGGRIGSGDGYYDRLIPKLPLTTRKVSLAYECQIVNQIPMVAHDKHVDILITENRIIYKI